MTRRLSVVLAVAVAIIAAWAIGRSFVTSVGSGGREEAAGVVLAPPADAVVEKAQELDATSAARALARLAAGNPGAPRVALTFARGATRIVLLLDREAGAIEERRGAPSGTRVATIWKGGLEARLEATRNRGTFDVPGLAPPEEKNLYH
ncbi:MAG: hypothetical protein U0529_03355 [Thermoanaerobaculia bacterium]